MVIHRLTRLSLAAVLVTQWVEIGAMAWIRNTALAIFANLGGRPPTPTILAIRVTTPSVLLTAGIIATVLLILAEFRIQTERDRYLVQLGTLSAWSLANAMVSLAFFMPLVVLGVKSS